MPRARTPKKPKSDELSEGILPESLESVDAPSSDSSDEMTPEAAPTESAPTARKPRKRKPAASVVTAVSAVAPETDSPESLSEEEAGEGDDESESPVRPPRRLIPPRIFPAGTRLRPWVWWALGGLVVFAGLLVASWFAFPLRTVTVSGNSHLTEAQVRDLAGAQPGYGWLYYGRRRAAGLLSSPWIQSARVTRQFPGAVSINITERQPFVQVRNSAGQVEAVAADGQFLPDAAGTHKLPLVSGWGPPRLIDAVRVARALSRYTVQSVTYTPSGLTIKTAKATVWSGDPNSLVKYAGSISMYPNQKINVYPWGVSVQ